MSASLSVARLSTAERRNRILDAAEACFVRNGFHRTTMNDVAAEAEMSAGNLYRYVESKEAIVRGLTERDREKLSAEFERAAANPDVFDAIMALARRHLAEEPREKAILGVEIWSEASRNPKIALLCGTIDDAIRQHLTSMLSAAQARGIVSPTADVPQAVQMLFTFADGLFKRRALEPHFDGEAGVASVGLLLRSLLFKPLPAGPAAERDDTSLSDQTA